VVHAAPVTAVPLAHVHAFSEHPRSVVLVGALLSYWLALQVPGVAHVPLVLRVGAIGWYSTPVQLTTGLHTRFCVALGAVVSYVVPSVHVVCAVHSRLVVPVGATDW